MGAQRNLWAFKQIFGRSREFVGVQKNYGRSAELRPKSQMDESTKKGENPSKDGFRIFFEKKKKRKI